MSFIAALDQSGGSTPGTLERYGYSGVTDLIFEQQMDLIHQMRLRIINSPSFTNRDIDTAIIFEDSAKRGIVDVLRKEGIRSFLKIDKGLNDDGTMKPFDAQEAANLALYHACSGTKMRSVVHSRDMVDTVVKQQLEIARIISDNNLTPIVEPEIPIYKTDKESIETKLLVSLISNLQFFKGRVILKLTLPERKDFYSNLLNFDSVTRIVALSGGYSTDEACERLKSQRDMSASFSRGLTEGLSINQTDKQFDKKLKSNISKIVTASTKKV